MAHDRDTARAYTAQQKRAAALEMRLAGKTYQDIVDSGLYANKGGAHKAVSRALSDITRPQVEAYRTQQLDRQERLLRALWNKAMKGDVEAVRAIDQILRSQDKYVGFDPKRDIVSEAAGQVADQLNALREAAVKHYGMEA